LECSIHFGNVNKLSYDFQLIALSVIYHIQTIDSVISLISFTTNELISL